MAFTKRSFAKKNKTNCPRNASLLKAYHSLIKSKSIKENDLIERILKVRPVRSLSGVVNISVLLKPHSCPGKCTFCPQEEAVPKSYLSGEPAVERAKRLKYNPFLQIKKRIEMLEENGHNTDKIDLRVIGGTFSSYSDNYKIWFITRCFEACNGKFEKKEDYSNKNISLLWKKLEKEQTENEIAEHRIVAISFETRPDYVTAEEIKKMRRLGATKIEIGVQSIYEDVLKKTKRGHNLDATVRATALLRNAGFKISYQLMLNLPLSTPKRDLEMFHEIFNNENFKPDYLKIYPCALVKNSALYSEYKKGEYKPYTERQLIDIIKKIKKEVPYYVRIERIIRDIPAPLIVEGGAKVSNLRQIIEKEIKKENWSCKCIRCREIKDLEHAKKIKVFRQDYIANKGKEIFLSFEDPSRSNIYSMLRLRILGKEAVIRELHTYGESAKLHKKGKTQHKGLGKALVKEAENIATGEFNAKKIFIISGVGVRGYYRRLGYELKNYYMVKTF